MEVGRERLETLASKAVEARCQRLEARRRKRDRRMQSQAMLIALIHARLKNGRLARVIIEKRKKEAEAIAKEIREKELKKAGFRILTALRSWDQYKKRDELREYLQRSQCFDKKICRVRWLARLHARCWRRKWSRKVILTFLKENVRNRGRHVVTYFMARVRRLQRLTIAFLQARRDRKAILLTLWDHIEARSRSIIQERKEKRKIDPFAPLPSIRTQSSATDPTKIESRQRIPELINFDLHKIKRIHQNMNLLNKRQHDLFGETFSPHRQQEQAKGHRKRQEKNRLALAQLAKRASIEDIMRAIVRANDTLFLQKTGIGCQDIGTAAATKHQLKPRCFDQNEVAHILSLQTHKGLVKRLESFCSAENVCANAPSSLLFFTAFFPHKKLVEVVAEKWLRDYNQNRTKSSSSSSAADDDDDINFMDLSTLSLDTLHFDLSRILQSTPKSDTPLKSPRKQKCLPSTGITGAPLQLPALSATSLQADQAKKDAAPSLSSAPRIPQSTTSTTTIRRKRSKQRRRGKKRAGKYGVVLLPALNSSCANGPPAAKRPAHTFLF